jgi:hypothetical protein
MENITLKHAIKGIINLESGVNPEALVEILLQTPNANLAIAKLFGEYKEPELDKIKVDGKDRINTFKSYDPWSDYVYYTYERNKTKNIYISKAVDKSVVTAENYKEYEMSWNNDGSTQSLAVTLLEMESMTENVSLKTWNSWAKYISNSEQKYIDSQNLYC